MCQKGKDRLCSKTNIETICSLKLVAEKYNKEICHQSKTTEHTTGNLGLSGEQLVGCCSHFILDFQSDMYKYQQTIYWLGSKSNNLYFYLTFKKILRGEVYVQSAVQHVTVMGWNLSSKFLCWIHNPQYLRMRLFGNRVFPEVLNFKRVP